MNTFIFVFLLSTPGVTAVLHTLRYFYTASSDVPNFPEFVVVGYVDDFLIGHYDSNTRRAVPKNDWIKDALGEDYMESLTARAMDDQQQFKVELENLKPRFNQSGGVHTYQNMYGCDWDDETGEVYGYEQYAYDGEDFISLNVKELRWIAAKQQAFVTKLDWDNNKATMSYLKYFLTQECPEVMKKIMNAGRSFLMRTDLPSIQLLQRTPSSPVTCHATGFYPRYAEMFWRKDQEEKVLEGVDHGEILPNHDGSFQMSVDLNISLIRAEDWSRYDCVFQIKGVEEDLTVTLDKSVILSNWRKSDGGVVAAVVVVPVLVLVAVVGFVTWKKCRPARCPSGFTGSHTSDTLSSSPGESDRNKETSEEQREMMTLSS
ncbi:major histocompatibility complex class I-related gene protein-like [Gouania willdenowi]|uniref:major histocompatibility complex class I-related gene protein-like n=1 Tax=Gouania willdenowi TaxID=441366 RepID=UPI0010542008|nr:major histocompatibility complex class I-related gene protein-like [Gouania willdenowi]